MANEKETEKGVTLDPRMYHIWQYQETGDQKHYEALRKAYTQYIHSLINKYSYSFRGLDKDELKQVADIALLDSIKGFDLEKGSYSEMAFNTYMSSAVQRALWQHIRKWTNYASRGDSHLEVLHVDFHTLEVCSPDRNDELTNADGINSVQTFQIIGDSLEDAEIEFIDLTREDIDKPDEETDETPEELLDEDSKREKDVNYLLNCLDDRERTIIILSFGLGGTEKKPLDEIGKQMGLSLERASKLKTKALEKMRIAALQNNIVYY